MDIAYFELYIKPFLWIATPILAIVWGIFKFVGKRIVDSLDQNLAELRRHSDQILHFAQRIEKLSDQLVYTNSATNTEINVVKSKLQDNDNEIESLRADRHTHGNVLTAITLKLEGLERQGEKLEKSISDLNEERIFVGDRMHDIINIVSSIHGLAKYSYSWPLPDQPHIRERKKT